MPARPLPEIIDAAELRSVLESLPDGLETELGEGGALVSGGEGQRVRFGRSLMRPGVRLAILDEAFRGLGIEQRRKLHTRARRLWSGATLLSITHDVGETLGFERVLVIENGCVVEDGVPEALAAQVSSRYRAMIEAERAIRQTFWSGTEWNRLHLEGGRIAV
jgi:ATP-binding cassette subfamily B protein